jgi:transcriptional antiterminator RfaH
MPFWAAAQLQLHRDRVALHLLQQAGFETYAPRLRERRIVRGRKVVATPLLFPGYAFVFIQMQWHTARWTPGVIRLVMDGVAPAVVPNAVITELQAREVGGLIELPAPFRPGDRVRIRRGAFIDHIGLVAGMKPHERVEVLLSLLGGQRRVTLPVDAIESAVLSFALRLSDDELSFYLAAAKRLPPQTVRCSRNAWPCSCRRIGIQGLARSTRQCGRRSPSGKGHHRNGRRCQGQGGVGEKREPPERPLGAEALPCLGLSTVPSHHCWVSRPIFDLATSLASDPMGARRLALWRCWRGMPARATEASLCPSLS